MEPDVLNLVVVLGTGVAIIGVNLAVSIALYIRLDTKIDSKVDGVARDVLDIKVAVARIEGHLEARDGFTAARSVHSGSEPDPEQDSQEFRQVG